MTTLQTAIVRRRAQAALRLSVAGGLAVMLAGCYETTKVANNFPTDYRERHPITLKEGSRSVEIFLGQNRGGLTPSQRADVLSFAQQWKHEGTSGIIMDVPHGGQTDRAAADSLREIHSILAASGVPRRAVYVRNSSVAPGSLASIKINYTKLIAEAGPCGLWPHDLGPAAEAPYGENQPYWNLGCSNQRNLASMIDNPADLVQPRGESPAYAPRRAVMMDKYRKGDSPSATYPNDSGNGYQSGKVSDVGK